MDAVAYLALLRRRWLPILVCLAAGIAGAIAITRDTPKEYHARTTLFVNLPAASGVQESLQGVELSSKLLKSYARIASSRAALEAVIDRLELTSAPAVWATAEEDTLLISINSIDRDPVLARRVADAAGAVLIGLIDDLEQGKESAVKAQVIESASTPTVPVRPRPGRNLGVGVLAGLAVGVAMALVLEALDRTVKVPAQATEILGAPLLGAIPRRREGDNVISPDVSDDDAGEAYRALRTAIRFISVDRPIRSLLVTSPGPREGKTVTSVNLAAAMAQGGERVVLVDADLRRPRLQAVFGDEPTALGLSSVLTRQCTLEQAMVAEAPGLWLLPAGPVPPNPAEVASSEAMAQLIEHLHVIADIVLIDTAPILPVTDAVALATQVDGVILVVRSGRTRGEAAAEAKRKLDVVGANLVGYVLNSVKRSERAYAYTYGYGYARPAPERRPPAGIGADAGVTG